MRVRHGLNLIGRPRFPSNHSTIRSSTRVVGDSRRSSRKFPTGSFPVGQSGAPHWPGRPARCGPISEATRTSSAWIWCEFVSASGKTVLPRPSSRPTTSISACDELGEYAHRLRVRCSRGTARTRRGLISTGPSWSRHRRPRPDSTDDAARAVRRNHEHLMDWAVRLPRMGLSHLCHWVYRMPEPTERRICAARIPWVGQFPACSCSDGFVRRLRSPRCCSDSGIVSGFRSLITQHRGGSMAL